MAERRTLNVNGKRATITVDDPDMPLLYALRDELGLHGLHFGCGLGAVRRLHGARRRQGGALLRDADVGGRPAQKVVTLEGLGTPEKPHPVQQAFIDEQAAQCGYCINGMIMQAAAFLADNKKPDRGPDQAGARRQPVPLRHARAHPARGDARRRRSA